jgi:hypothetical protein
VRSTGAGASQVRPRARVPHAQRPVRSDQRTGVGKKRKTPLCHSERSMRSAKRSSCAVEGPCVLPAPSRARGRATQGPSTCPPRASAARDDARDDNVLCYLMTRFELLDDTVCATCCFLLPAFVNPRVARNVPGLDVRPGTAASSPDSL